MTVEETTNLMQDKGVIRNKLKIQSIVNNAKKCLLLKKESDVVDTIWNFVGGTPIINYFKNSHEIPSKTVISESLSKYLKNKGF